MSAPDTRAIADALARAGHPGVRVHGFDELASTNAWLGERGPAPDGAPELCIADSQVRGAGRRGRGWHSLPGDITFSIRRRFGSPAARLAPLGLVTGIAVARALRDATPLAPMLKWPNDLWLGGSKLGGLLIESRSGDRASGCTAVGGIGINLVKAAERSDDPGVATLGAHGIGPDARDDLVAAIAARTLDAWTAFDDEGWAVFEDDWEALDALRGRAVRVFEGAPRVGPPPGGADPAHDGIDGFDGIARGVDGGGALRVERADGCVSSVHAGDVSVRPRA